MVKFFTFLCSIIFIHKQKIYKQKKQQNKYTDINYTYIVLLYTVICISVKKYIQKQKYKRIKCTKVQKGTAKL